MNSRSLLLTVGEACWAEPSAARATRIRMIVIRLLEALWGQPPSAKELAALEGLPTERLYYHLGQMEKAHLTRLLDDAAHHQDDADDGGIWTRVLAAMVDLQDRTQ